MLVYTLKLLRIINIDRILNILRIENTDFIIQLSGVPGFNFKDYAIIESGILISCLSIAIVLVELSLISSCSLNIITNSSKLILPSPLNLFKDDRQKDQPVIVTSVDRAKILTP